MKSFLAWLLWLCVAAGVYFFIFMMAIFGLASAGAAHKASAENLALATAMGSLITMILSLYFMLKRRYLIGIPGNAAAPLLIYGFYMLFNWLG